MSVMGGGGQLCTTSVYSRCVQMMCVCVSMCVNVCQISISFSFKCCYFNCSKLLVEIYTRTSFLPGIYYIFPTFLGRNFSPVKSACTISVFHCPRYLKVFYYLIETILGVSSYRNPSDLNI